MLSKNELWSLIEPLVAEEGLELFDIDLPHSGGGGILRITISRPAGDSAPVGVEDCARMSRKVSAMDRFEEIIPAKVVLEVSSPGVNRRLRRAEHFAGAVGEHVKLKVFGEGDSKTTVTGVLLGFDGESIDFEDDSSRERIDIPLADISEARVDYIFE